MIHDQILRRRCVNSRDKKHAEIELETVNVCKRKKNVWSSIEYII